MIPYLLWNVIRCITGRLASQWNMLCIWFCNACTTLAGTSFCSFGYRRPRTFTGSYGNCIPRSPKLRVTVLLLLLVTALLKRWPALCPLGEVHYWHPWPLAIASRKSAMAMEYGMCECFGISCGLMVGSETRTGTCSHRTQTFSFPFASCPMTYDS